MLMCGNCAGPLPAPNEGGVIIPMFAAYVMAHSDKVMTPEKVGANWTMDGFRAIERWWFG